MFDLVTIGDATIDTFIKVHDAEVLAHKGERELCVGYGDKIAVDSLVHLVAGNAANNAIGAKRLGLKSAIYVNVGDDSSGERIVKKLKEEGVSCQYVVVNKGMESNFSAVLNFQGERTIFVYHQPWKYHLPDLEKCQWIYFTSLSPSFSSYNIVGELAYYLERTGTKLLYNPGTYQIQSGVKKTVKLLLLSAVFIVNVEEAKRILGFGEEKKIPVKKLLKSLADLGPKMVVITGGSYGSYSFDGTSYFRLGIFPAKLLEMTGAGDAYATGLLAGLFYGQDLAEAMRWGAANGASVVEAIGPQAGLLTYEGMQKKLRENDKIIAKLI